jgi:beta-glucuronidase
LSVARLLGLIPFALLVLAGPAKAQTGVPAPVAPEPPLEVTAPSKRVLIREGQDGRMLLDGRWYFRQDDDNLGEGQRWFQQRDLAGWSPARVPHNWNATDLQFNRSSVGWYRKEFRLPAAPKRVERAWVARFQGANYRATVWLNGRRIGYFVGYFPFEVDLDGLRKGRNTLVVRVSSMRGRTDLTHWRPAAFNGYGTGGWWNFGGLLREVYVRAIDTIDVESASALARLRCVRCPARVTVRARLRNVTSRAKRVVPRLRLTGPGADERIALDPQRIEPRGVLELEHVVRIDKPRLWQPRRPALYSLAVSAETAKDERVRGTYRLSFGVRRIESRDGVLLLNGRRLRLRGASIHEDDARAGGASTPATRRTMLRRLRDLGATLTRSHYPLHPAFIESLDRLGILYWVDAPVYQLPNSFFDTPSVRASAQRAVRHTVAGNLNHPSILAWSLANEPAGNRSELGVIGPGLNQYIRQAAAEARELDDTRLIAIDRQSRLGEALTSPAYAHLDALGVNEYFGWYPSYRADVARGPTTTAELGPYLDALHAANPDLPLVITEFGAEASRDGLETQRGTFAFQTRYVLDHLGIHASKRYVAGSLVWALRDFRVEPTWSGGAPAGFATPPWNNKSLVDETNAAKPVYQEVRERWRRTRPLG